MTRADTEYRKDIIRMAIESQLIYDEEAHTPWIEDTNLTPFLERFAALVVSAERDACADMVYRYISQTVNMEARGCLASVAYDIRARGQA